MQRTVELVDTVSTMTEALQFFVKYESEVGPDPYFEVRPIWVNGRADCREFELTLRGVVDG